MPAYLYSAPAGVAGDVTRVDESNVEPGMLVANGSPESYPQAFGIPLKNASGGFAKFVGNETAADFAAILTRAVPAISQSLNQGFNDNVPYEKVPQGILVRGYCNVKCTVGTPTRGGTVYVRVVADTGKAIGDFEASSDTTKSVALSATQATWASDGKDADNNAEIRVAR